ncbi:MAG: acetyl-CoA C-acetyltransferase [Actinomycetia bacterium]|nr:acetyl-CoA C-acetyltransferase [Actinomycetes bacterium]
MSRYSRPVSVVGGNRLPFARAFTAYAEASSQDLLTAALAGLIERFDLAGELLGQVACGAVLKHSRDYNLTRECVLGSALDPRTPACDVQQACCTGLETTVLVANKIALGQIDSGIAGGADTMSDVPLAFTPRLRAAILAAHRAHTIAGRASALARIRPWDLRPDAPPEHEPRTGKTMHQHAAQTALDWGVSRAEQDAFAVRSHRRLAAAYDRGDLDALLTPFAGLTRDNGLRPDTTVDVLATLPTIRGTDPAAGLTAGNATPLSDGAAVVLLASDEWAAERGLPVLAHLTDCQTAAVDYVDGAEGLLMAPVYAVPVLLDRLGLALTDFDRVEVNEAYAAQVLCTLAAWADPTFCTQRLARAEPLGSVDLDRLNVAGGALALGHPFAATGGRLVALLAGELAAKDLRRGLLTICAAGGLGAAAVLER